MLRKILYSCVFLFGVLLSAGHSHAEDIDIFLADPDITTGGPNVLFVIDNGASWSSSIGTVTKEEMVVESLHYVVTDAELTGKVNLGLMPFAHGNSPKGGTVLLHVDPLTAARQADFSCRIYSTTPGADGVCPAVKGNEAINKGNNSPYGLTLNEAYRYYRGLTPASGLQDGAYSSTNTNGYDPKAISGGYYNSPVKANPCASNFIIVIGTGDPDNGENNNAEAELKKLGGWLSSDPVTLDETQYQSSWGDEYARFLAGTDLLPDVEGRQSVITYVIDVFNPGAPKNKPFLGARAYYKSIADQGRGKYFTAQNKEEVAAAVENILEEVQSINTVFASVSLPISVNVQGTNANQVYIGMFRPDSKRTPRWMGNIKRYQYLFDDQGQPYLAGKDGQPAYNPATGFIIPDAVSYWTEASTYWAFNAEYGPSDSPDGNIVEKGAAAQRLRERATERKLLACVGACSAYGNFDTANTAVTSVLSNNIINWVRGQDIQDENGNLSTTDRRPSIHGDVLHSRPAVVNYNRSGTGDNDIIIFYGANDGVFRGVDGGTGAELWGLILDKHFNLLEVMYDNFKALEGDPWRPYAIDGNPTVITLDNSDGTTTGVKDGKLIAADGDKVYLYLSMRRGGRMLHAIDVSVPENPVPMWTKDNTSTGYAELGQSWSAPAPAYVKALGKATPVLIFGLGYDAAFEDKTSYLPNDAGSIGRGIMVVNALTGDPIWQAGPSPSGATHNKTVSDMTFSIPSEVRLVNRSGNSDNYAEYIYVGDTGGNIWRVDIRDVNPADWTVTKMASVGGCTNKVECRKFLYPPSIVFGPDYDAVLIGSGDREKPFDKTITNRFYMFKDTKSGSAIIESELLDVTATPTDVDGAALDAKRGWYFTLEKGEKVVGQAITLGGTTIFNTNKPSDSANKDAEGNIISCVSNLGEARQYQINYLDGSAIGGMADRFVTVPGGGYPPPPVPMTLIDPNTKKPWTGLGGLDPVSPGGTSYGRRVRTFWFKDAD